MVIYRHLENHYQDFYGDCKLHTGIVSIDAPQGLVLGPILYLLYLFAHLTMVCEK